MSGIIKNNQINAGNEVTVLKAALASNTGNVTPLRRREPSNTNFGAAIQSSASRHDASVRAVAARYDNFQDALLPMVLASGVTGDAAVAVADAIQANPALKAQAERAFQRAQLTSL